MNLPVDIWWKIINYVLNNISSFRKENYLVSNNIYKNVNVFGKTKTSDIFLFRRLCKLTKKAVDKYTNRYFSKYKRQYHIVFKY